MLSAEFFYPECYALKLDWPCKCWKTALIHGCAVLQLNDHSSLQDWNSKCFIQFSHHLAGRMWQICFLKFWQGISISLTSQINISDSVYLAEQLFTTTVAENPTTLSLIKSNSHFNGFLTSSTYIIIKSTAPDKVLFFQLKSDNFFRKNICCGTHRSALFRHF